jgi:hypothetical protein
MSVTTALPALEELPTRNPRDVVDSELFDQLVERVRKEYVKVARFYAELMVEQMLSYLATAAVYTPENTPGGYFSDGEAFTYLTPSEEVDDALHAFLDLTADYRGTGHRLTGGRFIDHVPVTNTSITSGRSIALIVRIMREHGWPIDDRMWAGGASCCSDICQGRLTTAN